MIKRFRSTLRWMILDCVIPTHYSVIKTFTAMLVWSVFFKFYQNVCYFVMYAYFIDILQGSVETHLRCGGIYNNHINCKLSVECANERITTCIISRIVRYRRRAFSVFSCFKQVDWWSIDQVRSPSKSEIVFHTPCNRCWSLAQRVV